ncbi:putative NADH dehydrogenase [Natrialba magadii ATCC 43099]|uniref:FAD-dependent pyridine nucleotide-disulfide oxidoreductase n=1 Tax=Natrialba magadii (strain ATCC 43099 / DSM 3394 / CCM 3739 / CIP 104546 / IAM 13178 / JCM 8861 / NBRC 102185 / NCIMB 2190 / MS3) TaxID=547559 RepID=D3SX72_NATMM|nr:NAD(P)/FAD-dependent oxidoreductase [Natrialba magadii]ADD03892.1 putative NADH dehydrogenase [Natrialba magadii ATCC 43099]ELY33552.1 FAD-dependent pyridine nucleotide-disulfide oxidoreductase [Natrialba magadii ATCC 43099]
MTENVVVLGAGYAGTGAITKLQSELGGNARLTWIADVDYHLVLHEAHRVVRDPDVRSDITFPVDQIADPSTRFIQDEVVGLDVDEQVVELAEGDDVDYDYVLVALGSQTAYYGIPGLEEHSLTLKSLDDAMEIHDEISQASQDATRGEPAQVVVGGAGLSGIQTAGEIAEFRDNHRAPIEIHLVEALDEIFPGNDPEIQQALRDLLENAGVHIHTDDPITEAKADVIEFDEGDPLEHDVLIWTGGITGRDALDDADLEKEHNRVNVEANFQTTEENVFAIGDSALIDQGDRPAPPTAQAAWQAAEVVGENISRAIENRPLKTWEHEDRGTVVSVGDKAVAHEVKPAFGLSLPVGTFGGFPAKNLKKMIAAKWIASVTSWNEARKSWSSL